MTTADPRTGIRDRLVAARERTLWLLEQVPEEFLRCRVHSFYSPIGWHFGHIGRTEEWWIMCEALKRPCLDEGLSFLLADRADNPKDNRVNVPDREGLIQYLRDTRSAVLDELDKTELDEENPYLRDGYVWEFALQHECQHQETIAEMLCLIHQRRPQPPIEPIGPWCGAESSLSVKMDGGAFTMGSDLWCGYDNEKCAHQTEVGPFDLDEMPVTAYQWSLFIDEEGYHRPEFWSPAGWAWRAEENAALPEYWVTTKAGYGIVSPGGLRPIDPEEPVSSISWFEAEAFAKWAGKRLPTEVEWEFAAAASDRGSRRYPWGDEAPSPTRASYGLESGPDATPQNASSPEVNKSPRPAALLSPRPKPAKDYPPNPTGIRGMAGGTWEWTSSPFLPYPGFEEFPYAGYSADHMKGEHRVCRGGSFATAGPILRCSFRNWYVPTYRQGFLGLRCAR